MDEGRQRIHDDLKDFIRGPIFFERVRRSSYARDAGWFEVDPLGVVLPRHADELSALVRYAAEKRLPLHPRGGGTSRGGESLGTGLVLDLSHGFRRILDVGDDWIEAEAGVTLEALNRRLDPIGRRVALDPDRADVRTLGGLVAKNAAGPSSLGHGPIADHVLAVDVVLSNGERARLNRETTPGAGQLDLDSSLKQTIVSRLAPLLRYHGETIRAASSLDRRLGYTLLGVDFSDAIDLARLFAGSHGTLAVATAVRLRTMPLPVLRRAALLQFSRLTEAVAAIPEILAECPTRCEILDWRSLGLAREGLPAYRDLITPAAEAALLVSFEDDEAARAAGGLLRRSGPRPRIAGPIIESSSAAEARRLLDLPTLVMPLLLKSRGRTAPVDLFHGIHVPPDQLPTLVGDLRTLFQKFELGWGLGGGIGPGLLRIHVLIDRADAAEMAKAPSLATAVFETIVARGGCISGEEGRGLIPAPLHRAQLGALGPICREIKTIFDPNDLLNPGKTGDPRPALAGRAMRSSLPTLPVYDDRDIQPVLRWSGRSAADEAAACNGCGACRASSVSGRMCPAFRALGDEPASPRAKVGLFQQLATGQLDPKQSGGDEIKQVADLCLNCRMCGLECPSAVDVSTLVLELKANHAAERGLGPADWVMSRLDFWGALACRFPFLFNLLIGGRPSRLAIERVFGLSRLRRWPRARRHSFLRRAEWMGLTRSRPTEPGPRVAYFVDTFANYFDQELAEAVVAVFRHCGVVVYVPSKQRGSGMAALQVGDVDRARDHALANLRVLGDAVREGYTIVCSEPTATLMLRTEYAKLTDDIDAALVSANTLDLSDYLLGLGARGLLPRPTEPVVGRVAYHQPCHQKALGIGSPSVELLRLIPGLDPIPIERGCSGMGGIFGLYRSNFRASRRAGRGLITRLREPDVELASTDCGTCRLQMEQGSTRRTLHPIKLLALGYGLNPKLRARYRSPKNSGEIV